MRSPANNVRTVLKNFTFLTLGKVLGDLFTFALFVSISRFYGETGIGQYSFAIAVAGFFVVLSDFGLYNVSIRKFNQLGAEKIDYGEIFVVRLITVLSSVLLLLVLIPLMSGGEKDVKILFLICFYQILYTIFNGICALFIAHEDMYTASRLELLFRISIAVTGVVMAVYHFELIYLISIFPIATVLFLVYALVLIVKKLGVPTLTISPSRFAALINEAVPFMIASFLRQLSTRSDVIMIGFMLGVGSAGLYNVAYRVVFLVMFAAHFLGISIFPHITRAFERSREEFERLFDVCINLSVLVGIPLAAGLWLVADDAVFLIFGHQFTESIMILKVLSLLLFTAFMKSFIGFFLMACNKEKAWTMSWWIAAILNIGGNILLIYYLGLIGAAISTVLSDLVLILYGARKICGVVNPPRIGLRLSVAIAGTAGFVFVFGLWRNDNIFVVITMSILLYLGVIFMFKAIRDRELAFIVQALKRHRPSY